MSMVLAKVSFIFIFYLKTALVNAVTNALVRIREEKICFIVELCSVAVSLSRPTEKVMSSSVTSTPSKRHKHGKVTHVSLAKKRETVV